MMKRLAIAYYSTYPDKGYKSEQIKFLTEELNEKSIPYSIFTMHYSNRLALRKVENGYSTSLPLIFAKLFTKLKLQRIMPKYMSYLVGEKLFGWIFYSIIKRDSSDVVLLRCRPYRLVKKLKNNTNKIIVVEADQQHPYFTRDLVKNELDKYQIKSRSIYTDRNAVNAYARALNKADLVVVYSELQKKIMTDFGVHKKIIVCELGMSTSIPVQKRIEINDNKIAFITYANHSILKGTHKLIELWLNTKLDFELFVAGSVDTDFQEFLSRIPKLPDSIKLLNNFDKNKLRYLSTNYNLIGVSLSLSEGYSRVISEYFENGIPVIVSEINDREIEENEFGFVVDYSNSEQLLNAIYHLAKSENYIKCKQKILDYSFNTHKDFSENLIKQLQLL